jgi:ATP-dependent RNA helicase DeaD
VDALAARGYDTPTTVQAAVMARRCAGRDLLVSSQTGSGKTIAFGMLVAQAVMSDGAAKLARSNSPRALVVAPTRELAAQVCAELAWLFKKSSARVQAVTGGTDVGRDARNLRSGVDIVVGTPGRLVDLLERTALDLGSLAVLVLDEADEMLDLGFREDLETILAAAPTTRRTHLFSATLPPPIQALARRYQSEALAVDPRPAGKSTVVHEDIQNVMHLCAPGDRLATVVNVLRAAGERERALVFCSRRDRVAGLCAELCDRGFEAVPLSGEMAQAERTRALAAVRDGRARVLVATNVAARGLDLPELGLVVHADLPEDPDALLHRSGRTGRAGRKGVSVVIAETTERNRAERLLRGSHIQPRWTAAPSAAEIARADRERLAAKISREAADSGDDSPAALELADLLLAKVEPRALLGALLRRELSSLPVPETLRPVDLHAPRARSAGPAIAASGRSRSDMAREGVVLFTVNLGTANSKAQPNWLLPLICRRGGVSRHEVGVIRVGDDDTVFEIAAGAAPAFAVASAERDPRALNVVVRRFDGPPIAPGPLRKPEQRPRRDHHPRPSGPPSAGRHPSHPGGKPAPGFGKRRQRPS